MTKTTLRALLLTLLAAAICGHASAESNDTGKSYEELGLVSWHRDRQTALAEARRTGKPLMVFSTELPGCNSCKIFGKCQLSHPLVVDGSAHFVPLVLGTRTWPTMYFQSADGEDIIPKVGYSRNNVGPLLGGMVRALEASHREVPLYLKLAAGETRSAKTEKATFGMGCFWSGEVKLGRIEGVTATRCGFLGGEVVEVTYDPEVISYRELVEEAQKLSCANFIVARTDQLAEIAREVVKDGPKGRVIRSDDEMRPSEKSTKYQLRRHLPYYLLPLTETQATRINAALGGAGPKPETYLSPTQRVLLEKLERLPENELRALELEPVRSNQGIAQYTAALTRKLDQMDTASTARNHR